MNKTTLTNKQVMSMCIDSVRRSNSLDYFYGELIRRRIASSELSEIKEFIANYSSEIFRRGRNINLNEKLSGSNYEAVGFGSREVEGDELVNFLGKAIDIKPLVTEIPDYFQLITGRGLQPSRIYLIEYKYLVHGLTVIQPVFKVIARYPLNGRSRIVETKKGFQAIHAIAPKQLFIVGRDRYTRDPFALGIPNGFINHPIEACLRWTMNVHVGDEVTEI